jgi:hypothetical protein
VNNTALGPPEAFDLNLISKVLKKTISTEKLNGFLCRPAKAGSDIKMDI